MRIQPMTVFALVEPSRDLFAFTSKRDCNRSTARRQLGLGINIIGAADSRCELQSSVSARFAANHSCD